MKDYRVTWVIDLEAESPMLAAIEALAIQRDRDSIAVVFHVQELGPGLEPGKKVRVDLMRLAQDVEADQEEFVYRQTHGERPRS